MYKTNDESYLTSKYKNIEKNNIDNKSTETMNFINFMNNYISENNKQYLDYQNKLEILKNKSNIVKYINK